MDDIDIDREVFGFLNIEQRIQLMLIMLSAMLIEYGCYPT